MTKPRYRLALSHPLAAGGQVTLEGNAAHYAVQVLRLKVGDAMALFNRTDGEWVARITEVKKRAVVLTVEQCLRAASPAAFSLTVCFAPIKGGRLETIIEKATELGATVLQPVLTARTIVDKVNLERAEAIAREAAEQCERTDWPEIREPVKLAQLLGNWPQDVPLIYGDESGESEGFEQVVYVGAVDSPVPPPLRGRLGGGSVEPDAVSINTPSPHPSPARGEGVTSWAILAGPEGGFTPEEFAMLQRLNAARGVSLGPRILRADTAIITLTALTLAAWGDWHERPRFGK